MSFCKKKTLVNSIHYEGSKDSVRNLTNKYWTTDKNRKFLYFKKLDLESKSEGASLSDKDGVSLTIMLPKKATWNASTPFYEVEQEVVFKADGAALSGEAEPLVAWSEFVRTKLFPEYSEVSDVASSVFYDHALDIRMPYDELELKEISVPQGAYYADVKSIYNFYIEQYENAMATGDMEEQFMPNLYSMKVEQSMKNKDRPTHDTDLCKLNTLAGTAENACLNMFKERRNRPSDTHFEQDTNNKKYFSNYHKNIKVAKRRNPQVIKELKKKFSRIGMTSDMVDSLAEFNNASNLFMMPMYASVEFKTDGATKLLEALRSSNLDTALMKQLMRDDMSNSMEMVDFHESEEKIVREEYDNHEAKIKRMVLQKDKSRPSFDLLSWWANYQQGSNPAGGRQMQSAIILDENENDVTATNYARENLKQQISNMAFHSKLRKIVNGYMRDYEDIIKGATAYSETLMYKIKKYRGKPVGRPIQTFYACNTENTDIMRFIDTQVKYDMEYTYVICAYQIVVGSQYYYKNVKFGSSLANNGREVEEEQSESDKYDYFASAVVAMRPSIKLIEVPIFAETQRIVDTPPVAPNIEIVPYFGVNNKLIFRFNNGFDDYKFMPPIFNAEDQQNYDKIRKTQKLRSDEPIRFKSDDPAASFEVFRIKKKPKTYLDFKGSQRALINTDISEETIQKASAATYIETLSPNTKYYYTFRSKDIHGYLSNPTQVYEVELVDNSGNTFPIVNVVNFKPQIPATTSKAMKKYLHIMPTVLQSVLNEEKSGLIDEDGERETTAYAAGKSIFLGKAEEDVWDKNFKIRLTSTQTGRIIDLNLSFVYRHVVDEEEYKNNLELSKLLRIEKKESVMPVDMSHLLDDTLETYDS